MKGNKTEVMSLDSESIVNMLINTRIVCYITQFHIISGSNVGCREMQ